MVITASDPLWNIHILNMHQVSDDIKTCCYIALIDGTDVFIAAAFWFVCSISIPTNNDDYPLKENAGGNDHSYLMGISLFVPLLLQLFIPGRPDPKPWPDRTLWAFASRPHQSHTGQRSVLPQSFVSYTYTVSLWHFIVKFKCCFVFRFFCTNT